MVLSISAFTGDTSLASPSLRSPVGRFICLDPQLRKITLIESGSVSCEFAMACGFKDGQIAT